jgi:hypothetical protein
MSAEEIRDDPLLSAELMRDVLEDIARREYEKGEAGTHGMPHTIVDEALGSSGLRRKDYRIIWHISPPNVARARQMPSLGGAYSKGIYYCRWSVRHTNFAATLRQEGAYMRGGLIAKGGAYMPDYTVR